MEFSVWYTTSAVKPGVLKRMSWLNRALKRPGLGRQEWLVDRPIYVHLAQNDAHVGRPFYSAWAAKRVLAGSELIKLTRILTAKRQQLKQKLDEHNIGVGRDALRLGEVLPHIRLDSTGDQSP